MALRQTAGFVESLRRLTGLDWEVPDFSTICRRQKTLAVDIPYRGSNGLLHFKGQKLNVELDMMPRHLLLISFGVQLAHSCASGPSVKTIAFKDTVNSCV